MPLWLGWLIAGAMLVGLGAFYYVGWIRPARDRGRSWPAVLIGLAVIVIFSALAMAAGRH